ncbi:DUF2309 domain-containing protein [Cellvibrio sp. pealriver]|uniref:DUF2309 domain-containing protein n=1 Tax=Cellvibrio sp. pealriver TaxID=1622269 RepID=UPI00066FDF84|nr:DUF2309 domain-containing protein [Cellvibrio sp. pealriver]
MSALATRLPNTALALDAFALRAAQAASARIAPVWPLDKTVAVNPWWHWRDTPMSQVAARLASLRAVRLLMPKAYYRRQFPEPISTEQLILAARELGVAASPQALVDYLNEPEHLPQWKNLSDWLDEQPAQATKMPWRDEITQQISQSCGLFYSYPERHPKPLEAPGSFYSFWRDIIQQDAGLAILMEAPELHGFFLSLPESPAAVISHMYSELQQQGVIDEAGFEKYCLALLLDINGWAAVFARSAQQGATDAQGLNCLGDLLAVRLAWEWALWWWLAQPAQQNIAVRAQFIEQFQQAMLREAVCHQRQQYLWVWQRALELSQQAQFAQQLTRVEPLTPTMVQASASLAPALQAVFCIDVRSEPMRRALESVSPDIQTLGFAGFFGLPIAYQPMATPLQRPQLPALLQPALSARPVLQAGCQQRQLKPLLGKRAKANTGAQAAASFGWVEAKGIVDGLRLLAQSFGYQHDANPLNQFANISGWELWRAGEPLSPPEIANLLAGVLRHMGLTQGFAPRVLLVAHGSCTANNPLAAGLDCGACGGQSGEVNVRVLAYFLNLAPVREALAAQGIHIPAATRFVPCLHNTTNDDIEWFAAPDEPAQAAEETWQRWLQAASERARAQRAGAMAISATTPDARARAFAERTRDWAQLRPEWGLANNAAFIVAPRAATRGLNLGGRAFLHDYHWQADKDFATLELIITAPMVVTQWINLQYYASMTDNLHYGSGNKLLHNVVGGNLGVFEGNGGDLRIGLPLQSLHDGKDWRHQPVRLNVYLAAPRQAIAAIIQRHPDIAALINNDWLYLFQWDREQRSISRYYRGQWHALPRHEYPAPTLTSTLTSVRGSL